MSIFSKLFGSKSGGASGAQSASKVDVKPELYGDEFRIFPEPIKETNGYRVAARIEKDIDGVTKTHIMIRADTMGGEDDARIASLHKAQIFIDQMGEAIFN
ncbi:HlyU family transcriptional regulator [Celeribacter ethanolicus]|uniref:HlyU family transcriptional regulator n=1 Tax=Celeribacter ethanolicus TaxID=1758178 RepID=UPI00083082C0|nr:HlyU family transcriptional regulator [Celeribacter ethanolicus]